MTIIIVIIIRIREGTAEYLEPTRAKILLYSIRLAFRLMHPPRICKAPTHVNDQPVVHSDYSKTQK